MIAFFDTSVHIPLLAGRMSVQAVLQLVGGGPIRLSPVVASELLRGARTRRAKRLVERLVRQLAPAEPASWRSCWLEAGRILPRIFARHEDVGLARLQNDVLLALTARDMAFSLVTADDHFRTIRRHVPFTLHLIEEPALLV
jgi:predicted nucleic acid-binding protein